MNYILITVYVSASLMLLMALGCVASDRTIPSNKAAMNSSGTTKEIYVSINGNIWKKSTRFVFAEDRLQRLKLQRGKRNRKPVLPSPTTMVTIRNRTGSTIGEYVSPVNMQDLLTKALTQKLATAGYAIKLVNKLPGGVHTGLDISQIHSEIEQNNSHIFSNVTINIQFTVDTWQNGTLVTSKNYTHELSRSVLLVNDITYLDIAREAANTIVDKYYTDKSRTIL